MEQKNRSDRREPWFLRLLGRLTTSGALGRRYSIALMMAAALAGAATFIAITNVSRFGITQETVLVLLVVDLALVLLLGATITWVLVRLWTRQRAGSVGARLHLKLVSLFALVAVLPAIIVVVLAALIFNTQVQAWFNDRVRAAVENSVVVADAYLAEHKRVISADVAAMGKDLSRSWPRLTSNLASVEQTVNIQAAFRNLPEAILFDLNGKVIARAGLTASLELERPPLSDIEQAELGEIVILTSQAGDRVRALISLDTNPETYLYVGRYVDSNVIGYVQRTKKAAQAYAQLEHRRTGLQLQFATIFVIVTLLLLLIAVGVGLGFANYITRPIVRLVRGTELVRTGNIGVQIDEDESTDEFGILTRAFNRMTYQLDEQRGELIEANRQLEDRRRFTEAVLAGVSAGVLGLDKKARINLPNRSASALLGAEASQLNGKFLADVVPEMESSIKRAIANVDLLIEDDVTITRDNESRTLHVRIAAERDDNKQVIGFVVTFDDMTELLLAQRNTAWADVARRIAHEIKNPLTPIQLSAERLKRKYSKEIISDRETFEQCTDTIVRQVTDIGRMVDEFTDFARMPNPVFVETDLSAICIHAVLLQENAHPEVLINSNFSENIPLTACDGGLISQAVTNLLSNAIEAIEGRAIPNTGNDLPRGEIHISLNSDNNFIKLIVEDNGRGLPDTQRDRLTEPYITTRTKGTGLGLAIVKRIMEQHDGTLNLDDRVDMNKNELQTESNAGAKVSLTLPIRKESFEAARNQLNSPSTIYNG
ncbi:MAG: PAS domain-containing sensor histidine kinase [Alphaproteobacteria bacterium]|jgi:two-component system nitrogen regulation sensor histidine kinase NtrY|nr:PAS domain-containing sensor histidine kinase [Alphaproteobacteria bacterium]